MRQLPAIFLALLCCVLLAVPALADEDPAEMPEEAETISVDTDASGGITVNVNLPAATDSAAPDSAGELEDASDDAPSLYAVSSVVVLDETETEEQSVKAVIESLFGAYAPRTQTVTETLSDGSEVTYTEIVPGVAGLDWAWLTAVALFALLLYSFLRMIGGLFSR